MNTTQMELLLVGTEPANLLQRLIDHAPGRGAPAV